MFIVFLALAIGPVVAGTKINGFLKTINSSILAELLQPTGQNNNDTMNQTATGTGAVAAASSGGAAATGTAGARIVKLF
jgi:1,3-beta-glucan synthase